MRDSSKGALLAALACAGCLSAAPPRHNTPGEPVAAFPARVELDALSSQPAAPKAALSELEVERWQLDAAQASPAPSPEALGFWDRLLAERFPPVQPGAAAGAPGRVRLVSELHCAAREMARFYVAHGSYPGEGLRNFLALRCGSTLPTFNVVTLHAEVPQAMAESAVETQLGPSMQQQLERLSLPAEAEMELGIGYARGQGRAAVVVYSGRLSARLSGFSPIVTGVGVTLRGELLDESSWAIALVNQGPLGTVACEADRSLALPQFQFFCPFATGDAATRIEIAVRRPKRVLFDTVTRALVRRSESDGLTYAPPVYGSDNVAPDARTFRQSLYRALNEARKAAGQKPLLVEARQAEQTERLVPHLFKGLLEGDRQLADRVALGLLAGWEVTGAIRNGAFLAGSSAGERRPARWLSSQLESPLSRFLLLDPTLSQVAVGATDLDPAGAAAVVTAYSLFQASDHERDRTQLLNELTQSRAARNLPRPEFLPPSPPLQAALARIEKEQISALAALQDTLSDLGAFREPLHGWAIETNDVREIAWPAELVTPTRLEVEVGLTHYKPKGAAWGQYAVLFVIRRSEREARIEPPARAPETRLAAF